MQNTDLEKLAELPVFGGLNLEAIEYINDFGDWKPALIENNMLDPETAYIIFGFEDLISRKVLFAILHDQKILSGLVYKIVTDDEDTNKYILGLKKYPLLNGNMASEVIQTVEKGIIFAALEINNVVCFHWSAEDIKKIVDTAD